MTDLTSKQSEILNGIFAKMINAVEIRRKVMEKAKSDYISRSDPEDIRRMSTKLLGSDFDQCMSTCFEGGYAAGHEAARATPVPMILFCPSCGARHLDVKTPEVDWSTHPHHTHSCQTCGMSWRPAIVPTVGVHYLPGFKNPNPETASPLPAAAPAEHVAPTSAVSEESRGMAVSGVAEEALFRTILPALQGDHPQTVLARLALDVLLLRAKGSLLRLHVQGLK